MPHWTVTLLGNRVHLAHWNADEEGPIWSGEVEIVRGAPAADSHPELLHAFLGIDNEAIHAGFIRHRWTISIPDTLAGRSNLGDGRRQFVILQARGAEINWRLELKLPLFTPLFVYRALARGFHATFEGQEQGGGNAEAA